MEDMKKTIKEENADWMLSKHKCDDCKVRVGIIGRDKLEIISLYQCTRCKTVWMTREDSL